MKLLAAEAGLSCVDVEGIAWSPTRGLHLSDDIRLNYLMTAIPGAKSGANSAGRGKPTDYA